MTVNKACKGSNYADNRFNNRNFETKETSSGKESAEKMSSDNAHKEFVIRE